MGHPVPGYTVRAARVARILNKISNLISYFIEAKKICYKGGFPNLEL